MAERKKATQHPKRETKGSAVRRRRRRRRRIRRPKKPKKTKQKKKRKQNIAAAHTYSPDLRLRSR